MWLTQISGFVLLISTTRDINECLPNPCQHGGNCTDGINSYTCTCAAGYIGSDCATDRNECLPNPCQNGGSCTDGINSYTCICVAGYTGSDCETDINECLTNPCKHGGSCTDGINSYTCICVAGYTGSDCATDINECLTNPCKHGGSCTDGINSYNCTCAAGYTGSDCATATTNERPTFTAEELEIIATLNLCRNFGGQCGAVCASERYIKHKWDLPLCNYGGKCCINETAYQGAPINREPNTTTATFTTTTTSTPAPIEDNFISSEQDPFPDYGQCGQMDWGRRRKRIVGGSVSPPGAWPWLLALRSMLGAHACSGALIAPRWMITAAHCFKQISLAGAWRVRVGERNLLMADEAERDIRIERIFIYPGYETRGNSTLYARYKHDLALVKLSEDPYVEPICLPPNHNAHPEMSNDGSDHSNVLQSRLTQLETRGECWVAGWGFTRDHTDNEQVMRQVRGDLVSSQDCSQMWGTQLENDMICFGDGTRGPCEGDSGGPLSCELDGQWYLAGVVSWGTEDCTVTGYPAVFTRIVPFLTWINATIRQHQ